MNDSVLKKNRSKNGQILTGIILYWILQPNPTWKVEETTGKGVKSLVLNQSTTLAFILLSTFCVCRQAKCIA